MQKRVVMHFEIVWSESYVGESLRLYVDFVFDWNRDAKYADVALRAALKPNVATEVLIINLDNPREYKHRWLRAGILRGISSDAFIQPV